MHIARYWATAEGESDDHGYWFVIRRGSDLSQEDAQRHADEALAEILGRCRAGEEPADSYAYSSRQLPEPILEEIHDAAGDRVAAITINRFGCEVLNTHRLAFLDVDLVPKREKRGGGLLSRLLGPSRETLPPAADETAVEGAMSQLRTWVRRQPGTGVRAYRTSAGLRYLFVRPQMDPNDALHEPVYEELGCDPLYRRLCVAQNCFRARLTAKPWRIDVRRSPPWRVDRVEAEPALYDRWHAEYLRAAGDYAACRFVEEVGELGALDELTERLIRIHDERAGATSGLPLA